MTKPRQTIGGIADQNAEFVDPGNLPMVRRTKKDPIVGSFSAGCIALFGLQRAMRKRPGSAEGPPRTAVLHWTGAVWPYNARSAVATGRSAA